MPRKIVVSSRLRELLPSHMSQLCSILDPQDKWKEMAAEIKSRTGIPMFNIDRIVNMEYLTSRSGKSPSREIITSWYTDNPTVGQLRDITLKIGSVRAARYITVDILNEIFEDPEITDDISTTLVVGEVQETTRCDSVLDSMPTLPIACIPEENSTLQNGCTLFTYTFLQDATNNFDDRPLSEGGCLLGEGGFGRVYKGFHPNHPDMAVKKLNVTVEFSEEEQDARKQFLTEITVLSRCDHENMLPLLGYSDKSNTHSPCLVYEYMPNGSLEDRLSCKVGTEKLPVSRRLGICKEVARGLDYLHNLTPVLIHRDIKSANILLDKTLTAKIGDCGTVREGPRNFKTKTHTVAAVGTMPYMPPEYMSENEVSVKLDAYSYGVVLLEILTSLPVYDSDREDSALPTHVRETLAEGHSIEDMVDYTAGDWGNKLPHKIHNLTTRLLEYKGRRLTISKALPEIEDWHVH